MSVENDRPTGVKPTAAVRVEGTLCDENREPYVDVIDRLREQQETYTLILLSPLANTLGGHRVLLDWVLQHDVPYDEIWLGPGFPECDTLIDNTAITI